MLLTKNLLWLLKLTGQTLYGTTFRSGGGKSSPAKISFNLTIFPQTQDFLKALNTWQTQYLWHYVHA